MTPQPSWGSKETCSVCNGSGEGDVHYDFVEHGSWEVPCSCTEIGRLGALSMGKQYTKDSLSAVRRDCTKCNGTGKTTVTERHTGKCYRCHGYGYLRVFTHGNESPMNWERMTEDTYQKRKWTGI